MFKGQQHQQMNNTRIFYEFFMEKLSTGLKRYMPMYVLLVLLEVKSKLKLLTSILEPEIAKR